jgi:hypothetical protein
MHNYFGGSGSGIQWDGLILLSVTVENQQSHRRDQ